MSEYPAERRVEMMTPLATYTITEWIDPDGRVHIAFETSNPPRGHHNELYSWHGKREALQR